MNLQSIDFRTIRPLNGSQHNGFEEFCCQIAALESHGLQFHRKGTGADAGVECYRIEAGGTETGWQAKYFFEFGDSQVTQLTESFKHALERHPNLSKYIVCLPTDLSDGRVGNRKSQKQRWDGWVQKCAILAAARKIEIELWGAFELTERLGRDDPLYSGRRMFWFNNMQFGREWLQSRFDVARAALGERYAPELNIDLPIRRALTAFVRDPQFIKELENWADRLDESFNAAIRYLRDHISGSDAEHVEKLAISLPTLIRVIRLAPKGPADTLPIGRWQVDLAKCSGCLEDCSIALWDAPVDGEAKRERDAALHFTWRLRDAISEVAEALGAQSTQIANFGRLLVQGEAGVGKSHLLADVAYTHISKGGPAILVLGGTFSDAEPWSQILAQLGVSGITRDDFLGALDAAAEACGMRAVMMIDAINERQGIAVWANRLASFLQAAARFPRVSIIVSCRTTFLPWIVDPQLSADELPRIIHPGFAGRAAEAARRYLDQRGIVRMAAPTLAPEFENPLFLRTCCDLLERRGETEMPRGLSGISTIFDFYFGAVAETLTRRMGLNPRFRIVERAIEALTAQMVEDRIGYIPLTNVITILEGVHASRGSNDQSLLFQLENEGVIAVEPVNGDGGIIEHVRFTFERLSDHRIAACLLEDHVGDGDPATAFAEAGPLHGYIEGPGSYRFAGITEAFAVQIPERYGQELPDLVSADARWDMWHAFELSLLWRRQATFSKRTLELVKELAPTYATNPVLATLLAIATEPDNQFNIEHVDKKLLALAMPERDRHWSIAVTALAEEEGNPVETLIDWTLANAADSIDPIRARLVGLTLTWLLSLSHRAMRDRATKALAALFAKRQDLAAELIRHFADIDDAYVLDRVLAAAYAGALRNNSDEGLHELAKAAFNAVFIGETMTDHALIRDHARGIVELAASRNCLPSEIDPAQARPPYPARREIENIADEVIAEFTEDFGRGSFHDDIHGSAILDGDFARYEIDPMADNFLLLPLDDVGRTPKQLFERWRRKTIDGNAELVLSLNQLMEKSRSVYELPHDWDFIELPRPTKPTGEEKRKRLEGERAAAEENLLKLLGDDGEHEYRIRAASYVREQAWDPKRSVWNPTHQGEQTRRWVGWRAHDLGWTSDLFGKFDRKVPDQGRMEHRIERIGKKYQWIALHELAGRLSDRFVVKRGWREAPGIYQGPWDIGIREMDPSVLVTGTPNRERSDQPSTWWAPHAPRWKVDQPLLRRAWMADPNRDVPDPLTQIDVVDQQGNHWLVLQMSMSRNQWHMVDGDRTAHRMTWHKINCLLVGTSDRSRLLKFLGGSERERDHPPEVDLSSHAYLGEYAWHPSCASAQGSWKLRPTVGKQIEVHATVVDRYFERSGHDYSIDDSFYLTVPAPALMAGLNLRLADGKSLAYAAPDGSILFKDPSADEPGFSAAVVNRDAFVSFLKANGLEAVWTITGEKNAHGGPARGEGWGGQLDYWGLYTLAGAKLVGKLAFEQKHPSKMQLDAFLAGS